MTINESSGPSTTGASFPVGFHQLHPDVSMNVQMNRWFNCVGDPTMLEEMRAVAPTSRHIWAGNASFSS